VLLHRGEALIAQEPGYLLDAPGTEYGTFYVTDRRVAFEIQSREGLSRSEVRIPVQVPLPLLRNVAVGRPRLGSPVLHLEGPHGQYRIRLQNPEAVSRTIVTAREKLPELPPPPPPFPPGATAPGPGTRGLPPPPQGPAMPPPPPPAMAPAVVFRCRYCGGLSPPTETKCRSCGAPI